MLNPVRRRWTLKEFFAWQERQADRYELVDGALLKMMAEAKNSHDDIVVNVLLNLGPQLRDSGCRLFTGDGAIETKPGQIRRPDIGLDCGKRDPDAFTAAAPRLVVEVLSPSTRDFDTYAKLDEYKAVESLTAILLVEPNKPMVFVWRRDADGQWASETVSGLEASIEVEELGVRLAMAEIYNGVTFSSGSQLIADAG